jgi:hypothetical protein
MAELYQIVDESGKLKRTLSDGQIVNTSIGNLTGGQIRGFSLGRIIRPDGSFGNSIGDIHKVTIVHITEGQTYVFQPIAASDINNPVMANAQPVVLYTSDISLPNGDVISLAETIAAVRPVGQVLYSATGPQGRVKYVKVTPELHPITGQIINAPTGLVLATPEELVQRAIAGHVIKHAKQQIVNLFHSPAIMDGIVFSDPSTGTGTFYDIATLIAGKLTQSVFLGMLQDMLTYG